MLCHDYDCHCGHGPGCQEGLGAGHAITYKNSTRADTPQITITTLTLWFNFLQYFTLYTAYVQNSALIPDHPLKDVGGVGAGAGWPLHRH